MRYISRANFVTIICILAILSFNSFIAYASTSTQVQRGANVSSSRSAWNSPSNLPLSTSASSNAACTSKVKNESSLNIDLPAGANPNGIAFDQAQSQIDVATQDGTIQVISTKTNAI